MRSSGEGHWTLGMGMGFLSNQKDRAGMIHPEIKQTLELVEKGLQGNNGLSCPWPAASACAGQASRRGGAVGSVRGGPESQGGPSRPGLGGGGCGVLQVNVHC